MEVVKILEPVKMDEAIQLVRIFKALYAVDLNGNNKIRRETGSIIIEQISDMHVPVAVDGYWQCYGEQFNKSDLKPWNIVKFRNDITMIVDGNNNLINTANCCGLGNYEDKLTHKTSREFDIVEIYEGPSTLVYTIHDYLNLVNCKLIGKLNKI
jgi:hypothetical protein